MRPLVCLLNEIGTSAISLADLQSDLSARSVSQEGWPG